MNFHLEVPEGRPLALGDLRLPQIARVAVTAPHPDDFDAIAVALRWFHKRGHRVELAVLTRGTSGVDDGYAGTTTVNEKTQLREQEQRASCALFGLDPAALRFLRLTNDEEGRLSLGEPNRSALSEFLSAVTPDIIFLPHGKDSNIAHQRTYQLVTDLIRTERRSVLLCLNEDPKTLEIRRDLVVAFDEPGAEWKGELLRTHASQQARNLRTRGNGVDARVLDANKAAAAQVGAAQPYAECFELALYRDGLLVEAQS